MSWVEINLIICASLIPIIALFMVLPKIKAKKPKSEPQKQETPAEQKQEQKPADQPKEEKPTDGKKIQPVFESSEYSADDFKDYLKERNKNITAPTAKQMPKDFKDLTLGLDDFVKSRQKPQADLFDELNKMSPEMQAIVFAGLFDTKF